MALACPHVGCSMSSSLILQSWEGVKDKVTVWMVPGSSPWWLEGKLGKKRRSPSMM